MNQEDTKEYLQVTVISAYRLYTFGIFSGGKIR